MDLAQLAQWVFTQLQPHLDVLVSSGVAAVGSGMGKTLWEKLSKHTEIVQAAKKVVEKPDSSARKTQFIGAIEEALEEDASLQKEIVALMQQIGGNVVQAIGDRAVAIGGDVNTGTIITGDNNVVGSGNTVHNVRADKIIGSAIGDGSKVINRLLGGDDD